MIILHQSNHGKGVNRWAERDGVLLATIGHHPHWRREMKFKLNNVRDAWNVCWASGRVDWHNTLADARDNVLKGN